MKEKGLDLCWWVDGEMGHGSRTLAGNLIKSSVMEL